MLMTMLAIAAACAFVFVHEKGMERAKLPFKTVASLCFVALGAVCLWKSGASEYGVMVLIALVLGCVGDVFLQIPGGGDGCFISGLIAFLLGHLMYVAAFFAESGFMWVQPVVAVLLFAVVFVLLKVLKADFGDKKMLVYVYAAVIAVMMGCAASVGVVWRHCLWSAT